MNLFDSPVIEIRPQRVGQFLGGNYGVVVSCPKCKLPAWRKSEKEYVHDAFVKLNKKHQPELTVTAVCRIK